MAITYLLTKFKIERNIIGIAKEVKEAIAENP